MLRSEDVRNENKVKKLIIFQYFCLNILQEYGRIFLRHHNLNV